MNVEEIEIEPSDFSNHINFYIYVERSSLPICLEYDIFRKEYYYRNNMEIYFDLIKERYNIG